MTALVRDPRSGQWIASGLWGVLAALVSAVAVLGLGIVYQISRTLTPLQRYYALRYVRSTTFAESHLPPSHYELFELPTANGWRVAGEDELDDQRLRIHRAKHDNEAMRDDFQRVVYDGATVSDLVTQVVWYPLMMGGVVLAIGLVAGVASDSRRIQTRRVGRLIAGPELIPAGPFTRHGDRDGFVIHQTRGRSIVLSRQLETYHTLIVGGTGTGKSTLIKERLDQIRARGERAVVLDPKGEFLATHGRVGDAVLHPWDWRAPGWSIGDEVQSDLDAQAIAVSLIPHLEHEAQPFFSNSARTVLAALLMQRPTTEQLVEWMSDADTIRHVVKGTPEERAIANILNPAADVTTGNILSNLNLNTKTLQWCPPVSVCPDRWSATAWAAADGQGWLFITSTPATREALIPLQTLWINTLLLRLMRPGGARTHVILDEVDSLKALSQLPTALTEGRSYNLAIVLGFQSHAQLETRYGKHVAQTILDQFTTQIFLRSNGRIGSEWASKTIGDVELDQVKQSRQDGWARTATRNEALEQHVKPLVMASTISGLPRLRGYLKIENLVTDLSIPIVQRTTVTPAFVPRPTPSRRPTEPAGVAAPVMTETVLAQRME